ncbi:hypothetical protein PPYR_04000 [Photinus pyralis]|uniref:BRISC and BRCA1-A complex member 1 n=1 Tax=Photinus pyralis TaxID=7054 RepID=A0A1Y1LX77_PHOPY|nr:BRISC and BRCA1-A complex member 1-like [Photinus pyralis]KAB0789958.1 hypothetical protein PPYR_15754 [Photinus pyralis]KAB0801814.1 hypothetical protein PPYR_04000 [Photinus pyralis]
MSQSNIEHVNLADDISTSMEEIAITTANPNPTSNEPSALDDDRLPSYNVPEKIIIVLDRGYDENCTNFELTSKKTYSPLFMLQHALKIFLHNKSQINPEHQFAIIQLDEYSATWVHDFTNSIQDILASVRSITDIPCETEDIFDLNKVFDILIDKLDLSFSLKNPPSCVVHIVLLYGRSYSVPKLTKTAEVERLLNSSYCTVDVVMTHEPPDSSNNCEQIFKCLQSIDMKGSSYAFSVSRNASDLHCAMAKILSHPLQRPHNANASANTNYNLNVIETN